MTKTWDPEPEGSPYNPHDCPQDQIMGDALESFQYAWEPLRAALSARRNDPAWPRAERDAFAVLMFDGDGFLDRLQRASHAI